MAYTRRVLDSELDALLPHVAALAIDGPKAVGKTTTARERSRGLLQLDEPGPFAAITADPALLLRRDRPLLIDEWQRVPQVWDVVRRAVDDDSRGGQFLLTGSATPSAQASLHSGAGRIGRLRMRPMTLPERGATHPTVSLSALLSGRRPPLEGSTGLTLADYAHHVTSSGFPAIRTLGDRARRFQLDSYLATVAEHDFPELGHPLRRPTGLQAWLCAYAAASSTTARLEAISDAAAAGEGSRPARTTTLAYRETLMRLWLLDPLPAWTPSTNHLTRLQQSPKHHLADPALAARLLGLDADALLDGEGEVVGRRGAIMLGTLVESLATLSVRVFAQAAEADTAHLRTANGDHEVDIVVVTGSGKVVALEVKTTTAVDDDDTRHLRWLRSNLGDRMLDAAVLSTGRDAYRRSDGIGVIPLALLGP